jgi:hypothetical protein
MGGGGNALTQQVFTGHVDWSQVALSSAVGGTGAGAGSLLSKLAAARSVNAGGVREPIPAGMPEPATGTPIWRGVATDHHAYDAAVRGIALPGDESGIVDAAAHNTGFTHGTALTSWTTDTRMAELFAGKDGVILQSTVEELRARGVNILASPDRFGESEILVQGRVEGLTVLRPPWPWSGS